MSLSEATRRNGGSRLRAISPSPQPPFLPPPTGQSASSAMTAYQTAHKAWLLLLYPLILTLGSLTSLLSPSLRSTPYDHTTQSHPPHLAPSYFARKSNVFNLYFVKIAWAWYSGIFFLLVLLHASKNFTRHRTRPLPVTSVAQTLARYAVVTTWWCAVTQWFFGPPIIDRGFRFSGGRCEMLLAEETTADADNVTEVSTLVTAAACKLAGGAWKGGHDISGHVFLLVLGSAFLYLEGVPTLLASLAQVQQRAQTIRKEDQDSGADDATIFREDESQFSWILWLNAAVVGLSWWMLLMTATYFHTWFEKFTGLLVAYVALGSVYFLPQLSPPLDGCSSSGALAFFPNIQVWTYGPLAETSHRETTGSVETV